MSSGPIDGAVAAARSGDVAALEAWLAEGGNPNQHDAEGWTPLLAAAVRGREAAVSLLLDKGADPELRHRVSDALPIHFAGHSGSVAVAERLLAGRPGHLEAVWDINGHTLLLQAVFYGHVALTEFALKRGASTAATTLRGLASFELAQQFGNTGIMDLVRPHDSPAAAKSAYFQKLLAKVAPTTPPGEEARQALADRLVAVITDGLAEVAKQGGATERTLEAIRSLVEKEGADVNRLGGALRQPALIVAVTGNNGSPAEPKLADFRKRVSALLLQKGADPTAEEKHPMGVHAIIRAAVFNHLEILKMMGEAITPERLAAALNQKPVVNGLTALHDSVLRASMAPEDRLPGYLDQIRWAVGSGARSDIEDFSGRTQRSIAENVVDPGRRRCLLEALSVA